jgi:hypothetical protein
VNPSPAKRNTECNCTADQALAWSSALAEAALEGDDDAKRSLPSATEHWLKIRAAES